MSQAHAAMQYEASFAPKRLRNWEVPAVRTVSPTAKGAGFRTQTIVDDKGHLLVGPKLMNSFNSGFGSSSPKRWPEAQKGPIVPFASRATMGYKGISTSYLPTSTVFLKNNPDSNEFNFH